MLQCISICLVILFLLITFNYVMMLLFLVDNDSYLSLQLTFQISELENLYSRVCDLPINVKESEKLSKKISSAKVFYL